MKDQFETKDSGERQDFGTGSVRDSREGKGRFDLVPSGPLRRLAQLYERGAAKYGDANWQKGQPLRRYIDSAMRHLNELKAGEPVEDHAAAVAWNMFSYMWTLTEIEAGRLPRDLDDRFPPEPAYQGSKTDPATLRRSEDAFPAPDEYLVEDGLCPRCGARLLEGGLCASESIICNTLLVRKLLVREGTK